MDNNELVEDIAKYLESMSELVIMENMTIEEQDAFRSCWRGTATAIRKKYLI